MCNSNIVSNLFLRQENNTKKAEPNKLNFIEGEYKSQLKNLFKSFTYIKNVITICDDLNINYLKEYTNYLSAQGIETFNLILESKQIYSLTDFSQLFNLNKNPQAVVCFGGKTASVAKYFASINNLPIIYIITDYAFEFALTKYSFILLNDKCERVETKAQKFVVFDTNLINNITNEAFLDAYLLVKSKTCALMNARALGVLEEIKPNQALLKIVSDSIEGVDVNAINKIGVAYALLVISYAHCYEEGFSVCSDEVLLQKYVMPDTKNEGLIRFYLFNILTKLYYLFDVKNIDNNLSVPNYNERISWAKQNTLVLEEDLINYFLQHSKVDNLYVQKLKPAKRYLKYTQQELFEIEEKVYSKYIELGGKKEAILEIDESKLKEGLYYLCDVPYAYTLLDLLRDAGILEFLNK